MVEGRIAGPLLAIIRVAFSRIDYYGFYRARVTKQSANLVLVDVVADNPKIGTLAGIPLRLGLPAVKVQFNLSPAPYVLVGFMGGDPAQPYVHCWEGGEALGRVQLGGNTDAARKGDGVSRTSAMGTWMSAVASATGTSIQLGLVGNIGGIAEGSSKVGLG